MPTTNPVPSYDPTDLLFNAQKLDEVVNSTSFTYADRLGTARRTLAGLEAEFPNAQANAAAAAASATAAAASATQAGNEATSAATAVDLAFAEATAAQAARVAAESARDVAFVNANVYADIATGRSAVADGQQFAVASGDEIVRYRRDSGTTQTEVARYPSKVFVDKSTLFPGRASWVAPEPAALVRILSIDLYGADPAKTYFVKYHFWKDVGTRYNLTISAADDISGTGAADVAIAEMASGADAWTTIREVNLSQVSSSGVTGTALVDFSDSTAFSMNSAPTSAEMYQRRRLSQDTLQVGYARLSNIGVSAATALNIRNRAAQVSAFAGGTAGNDTQTGLRNTGFGYASLDALTTGSDNTGFGYNALTNAAASQTNSAFGASCLQSATGDGNSAVGFSALNTVTTGTQNAAIGFQAGYSSNTGSYNTALGGRALFSNTTGYYSVAVGHNALFANTATGNVAVGESAGFSVTSATNFTAVGRRAAYTKATGADCTFVGHQAGYSGQSGEAANNGEGITALGAYSFGHNTTGAYNSGFGRASGWYNSTGSRNAFGGYRCGYGNTVGNDNVAMGFYSLHNASTGSRNVFIGAYSDAFVPSSSMTATAVSGSGLSIGAYSYRVTFVIDGVETGLSEPSANATTTAGNQQVNLAAIPTYSGPRNCSARKIYRTPVGGENLLYLVATIGDNVTTTYSDTTADASLGAQPANIVDSIGIGYSARPLKSGQMVIGSSLSRITEVIVGGGVDDTSPQALTFGSSNSSGSNVAGADLRLRAGASTGSGQPGRVIIAAATPGAAGSTHNSTVDVVTIDGRGFLNIRETTSASVPTPAAGSVNLFFEGGSIKFRNSSGNVLTVSAA